MTYPFGQLLFALPTTFGKRGNKPQEPVIGQSDLQLIQELLDTPIPPNPFLSQTNKMVGELAELQRAITLPRIRAVALLQEYTPSITLGFDSTHQCADAFRQVARVQLGVQLAQAICFLSTGYCKNANLCIHLAVSYAEAAGFDFSLRRDFDDIPTPLEKAVELIINRLVAASALVEFEQKGIEPTQPQGKDVRVAAREVRLEAARVEAARVEAVRLEASERHSIGGGSDCVGGGSDYVGGGSCYFGGGGGGNEM